MPQVQTFDTGLTHGTRRLIREAVVAKLVPLTKGAGKYLERVVEFPSPFRETDPDLFNMMVDLVTGSSCVAAVACGRRDFAGVAGGREEGRAELTVHVYIASRHTAGTLQRQAGTAAAELDVTRDPGLDAVLDQVYELLKGADLGIEIAGELQAENEDLAWFASDVAMWEQTYKVGHQFNINRLRGLTRLATVIETTLIRDELDEDNPAVVFETELEEAP